MRRKLDDPDDYVLCRRTWKRDGSSNDIALKVALSHLEGALINKCGHEDRELRGMPIVLRHLLLGGYVLETRWAQIWVLTGEEEAVD